MAHRDIKKIDKVILENFYKLVHNQPNVRLTAALSTFKILVALKKRNPESFNEHLNYCTERLVSGLSSSRAQARRGYGTLLLELLTSYQISTDRLLSIASQKFGNISNETTKDNLLGHFLLITLILQSGNHRKNKANQLQIEKMYKILVHLQNIKSYLDYSVSKLISQYYEDFYQFMLANVQPEVFGSDIKVLPKQLLTVILCCKKQPLKQLLDMDSSTLNHFLSALRDEKLQRKPLHPLWIESSLLVMNHFPQQFESFCSALLMPTFFKPNHNELAGLGLELISSLIENAMNEKSIKALLSDYVCRLIILSLRNRTPLHKNVVGFFDRLKGHFEKLKNQKFEDEADEKRINEHQYIIINRLTTAPNSVAFDEDSKSSSIASLLDQCRPPVLKRYAKKLIMLLNKSLTGEEGKRIHCACARQIAHVIRRPQMVEEHQTTQGVAKFLIATTMFKDISIQDESFWMKHATYRPADPPADKVLAHLKKSYSASMEHIVSCSNTIQRIEHMDELIEYVNLILKDRSVQFTFETSELDPHELWEDYRDKLKKHKKFIKKSGDAKILYPITSLFLFYGFQIIEHGFDCRAQLEELAQSAKEALKDDPNDGSWADVLTDQIIAILSATECCQWIRKLCVSIFGSLLAHISEMSIDLLCDAIKEPIEGEDAECDDEEELDEDDESRDQSSTIEEMDTNKDESEESSEDEDEEMSVEDGGDGGMSENESEEAQTARADSNGEEVADEEEEEYLDDEQMMKLDGVLADMFKLNRVGKKKKDPSFKLRCLDLVKKMVIKKHNDAELMKKLLATLIPLAARSRKSAETRPISDKIDTMISKMPGKSKLLSSEAHDNVNHQVVSAV